LRVRKIQEFNLSLISKWIWRYGEDCGTISMAGEGLHCGRKTCLAFRVVQEMGLTIGLTITSDRRWGME